MKSRNYITIPTVCATFDGSYQRDKGAGIGVTLNYLHLPPFLRVACPTVSFDAQRTEALGLTLGALLLAVLPVG